MLDRGLKDLTLISQTNFTNLGMAWSKKSIHWVAYSNID